MMTPVNIYVWQGGDQTFVTTHYYPGWLFAYRRIRKAARDHAKQINGVAFPDIWRRPERNQYGIGYLVEDASDQPDRAWLIDVALRRTKGEPH